MILPSICLAMKICNCCFCWVSICNHRCHRSAQRFIMYPIVSNRISYLEENRRKKMSKKYKHNIASTIWISLFFFLSVCIWSSSSQASITTYTQSSSLHTTGAKLQKRVLSFSCSQHYRCCCFYFYLLYYYYFLCTLVLSLSLFLFYSGYVVVLATTTTGFPFLFFSVFFLLFLSFSSFFCRC